MLPFVSCVCPTFARFPDYGHLLDEAVESFLRQDYPTDRRQLVVLNDCPQQELKLSPESLYRGEVLVINHPIRFATLGQKYNSAVMAAHGDLVCPWEDDDLSLSCRISQAVETLGSADYWKPPQVIFWPKGSKPVFVHPVGIRHHASIYRKSAWAKVGGYPSASGGQDAGFDSALATNCEISPPGPMWPERYQYVYRWGTSPNHLSGQVPHEAFYQEVGRRPVASGTFVIDPHWREEYEKTIRECLQELQPPIEHLSRIVSL